MFLKPLSIFLSSLPMFAIAADKPVKLIILVGDSITGSYQNTVMKHFEGRANV